MHAVTRELEVGSLDPVEIYMRFSEPGRPACLLQSGEGEHRIARWSYIGFEPRLMPLDASNLLESLGTIANGHVDVDPRSPPFHGGAVGYLGYETVRNFERIPLARGAAPNVPEAAFMLVDAFAAIDHQTKRLLLVSLHETGEDDGRSSARLEEMEHRLRREPAHHNWAGMPAGEWRPNMSRSEYEAMVDVAREHIFAGDIFQVVLSQRFTKPLAADPERIYRELAALNPSPYMFNLAFGGGRHLIGTSPELLVRVEDSHVETRPLAGTRRRGTDAAEDDELERELLADEKERAEHVMLVDLGRNDVGRVARAGTVRVAKLMEVERYSHVMHISSTVSGELDSHCTSLDALRAAFPAGTVSGAPKIRAMQIIAGLEPERRGPYAGAVGYVAYGGNLDMAITLRTIVVADGNAYVQAGAGIVADSEPGREYEETLAKSRVMFDAIAAAEQHS